MPHGVIIEQPSDTVRSKAPYFSTTYERPFGANTKQHVPPNAYGVSFCAINWKSGAAC